MSETNVTYLRDKIDRVQAQIAADPSTLITGGGGGIYDGMDGRLGKLEGAVEGLRHSQNITIGAVAFGSALLLAVGVYSLQRIDQVSQRIDQVGEKVSALPGQIGSELRDITQTLATSIVAAKQTTSPAPQIIVIPSNAQATGNIDRPAPQQIPPPPSPQK